MKRDLYADVSARIVAELEAGAAPWVKPWSATPGANTPCNAVSNRPYSGLQRHSVVDGASGGLSHAAVSNIQTSFGVGRQCPEGQHGTKVYFVKQLQVHDKRADDETAMRVVPMLREYTVFNIDQCENLPDRITTGKANTCSQSRRARRACRRILALNWR